MQWAGNHRKTGDLLCKRGLGRRAAADQSCDLSLFFDALGPQGKLPASGPEAPKQTGWA